MAVKVFDVARNDPIVQKMTAEKLRALAAIYDPQIHKPKPACETCGGVRYVRNNHPIGHPDFGGVYPCPSCNRGTKERGRAGIFRADYNLTWADLLDFPESNAVQAGELVARILERGWGGVYLWGDYGTAKTEILRIAVAEWIRNTGNDARFILFADLLDEMTEAFKEQKKEGDEWDRASAFGRLQLFQRVPLLALDEIEEINLTSYSSNTRFRLFNDRYERATRLFEGVTLISSNIPPSNLPDKLQSRFSDPDFMVTFHVTGRDVRAAMAEFRNHPEPKYKKD